MAIVKKCDRCGESDHPELMDNFIVNIRYRLPKFWFPYREIHLCRNCVDEFFKFIQPPQK